MVSCPYFHSGLYLITDRHQLLPGKTLPEVIEQALLGGLKIVQLREKDLSAAELYPLAVEIRQLTRCFSAKLIINDRVDVALACDADGVHLGGHSLLPAQVRKLIGKQRLLGVSTHSIDDVLCATRQGADFLTFGPIFQTPSKAAYGKPLGLDLLQQAVQVTDIPILALGGIKQRQATETIHRGASGIALISAIMSSSDPQTATRALLNELRSTLQK